ncbi:MAG: glycyl-radical enzyme activating protein [Bacillota bacterium]
MKYSIHDGPGIRTAVFLKGCPMHCWWCHNPESQETAPQLVLGAAPCIGCGACLEVCPHGAVSQKDGLILTDPARCQHCLTCVDLCHSGARKGVGRSMTVSDVMAEVEKDLIFYDESGGGVTFSGGEPLLQPDFLYSLLSGAKAHELHTAVETTGFGKLQDLLRISAVTDLFLYDLKLMDDAEHRRYTGVSNKVILENLRELSRNHGNITIRIPIVPGITDQEENLLAIGRFAAGLDGVRAIHLLPYHKAGVEKYRRLRKPYRLPDTEPPDAEWMAQIADRMRVFGKKIKTGG